MLCIGEKWAAACIPAAEFSCDSNSTYLKLSIGQLDDVAARNGNTLANLLCFSVSEQLLGDLLCCQDAMICFMSNLIPSLFIQAIHPSFREASNKQLPAAGSALLLHHGRQVVPALATAQGARPLGPDVLHHSQPNLRHILHQVRCRADTGTRHGTHSQW